MDSTLSRELRGNGLGFLGGPCCFDDDSTAADSAAVVGGEGLFCSLLLLLAIGSVVELSLGTLT